MKDFKTERLAKIPPVVELLETLTDGERFGLNAIARKGSPTNTWRPSLSCARTWLTCHTER